VLNLHLQPLACYLVGEVMIIIGYSDSPHLSRQLVLLTRPVFSSMNVFSGKFEDAISLQSLGIQ
jgi:hypothetical protein